VSEFVEECRREWKRLGVPDPVASEMAADLAADLAEAESEGASAEEVLGSSAFDPRSFAASWAVERGVVPPRHPASGTLGRRPPVVAAIATIVVVALIAAALAILVSAGPSHAVAVATPAPGTLPAKPPVVMHAVSGLEARPIGWILLLLGGIGIIPALLLWSSWARTRPSLAPA